jgi:hypothetical protein
MTATAATAALIKARNNFLIGFLPNRALRRNALANISKHGN